MKYCLHNSVFCTKYNITNTALLSTFVHVGHVHCINQNHNSFNLCKNRKIFAWTDEQKEAYFDHFHQQFPCFFLHVHASESRCGRDGRLQRRKSGARSHSGEWTSTEVIIRECSQTKFTLYLFAHCAFEKRLTIRQRSAQQLKKRIRLCGLHKSLTELFCCIMNFFTIFIKLF